jgi:hypothetical protein
MRDTACASTVWKGLGPFEQLRYVAQTADAPDGLLTTRKVCLSITTRSPATTPKP